MTDKPAHTASKDRMVPEVMLSTERVPHGKLSITDLKVNSACFTALQMKNSGEVPLQSIQSPQKIPMIPIYKCREAINLLQIDTLDCQQKEMGKSMMCVFYILWYAKRHLVKLKQC